MINTLFSRFGRPLAATLVLLVASQMSQATVLPIQEPQQAAPAQQAQSAEQQPVTIAASSSSMDGLPQAPEPAAQQQGDQDAQKPVGTAAGPVTRPGGVAGSRPSGAVIAPAKQRRVKALFIRYTLIVAGVAATGAVIGLSKSSPSHPQ